MNEVKPVENINKNSENFLELCNVQKEVLPSKKLKDHECNIILSD